MQTPKSNYTFAMSNLSNAQMKKNYAYRSGSYMGALESLKYNQELFKMVGLKNIEAFQKMIDKTLEDAERRCVDVETMFPVVD